MGELSGIQWTTHTFNPWWGCQRISPGCVNCYAEALDKRTGGGIDPADGVKKLRWGPKAPRLRTSDQNWKQPHRWNRDAAKAGQRARVFCASMADVFEDHESLRPWRLELFTMIAGTPWLDWQLLTKRPDRVRKLVQQVADDAANDPRNAEGGSLARRWLLGDPPANVWLGTTVEDQNLAGYRIAFLLDMPARVHFLSCEPLLEAVDLLSAFGTRGMLRHLMQVQEGEQNRARFHALDWVIIGGESGPGAREFRLEWARDLLAQCERFMIAPFVKQLGACPVDGGRPLELKDRHGGDLEEWPAELRVRRFPGGFPS